MKDQVFEIAVGTAGDDLFIAHAVAFPELRAEAGWESEAVEKVRESLKGFLATLKIVKVPVPVENPWLAMFGHSADDPDFDLYLEEIRRAREAADEA